MGHVREGFIYAFQSAAKNAAQTNRIYELAEELGILDMDEGEGGFYFHYNQYSDNPSMTLSFYPVMLSPAADVMAHTVKQLLPKLGTLDKGFNEETNHLQLTAMYKGVRVILESAPPKTCTVETVVEEVEVPEKIIPAHTEKKTRYVLKGDCDPLLAPSAEPTPVVESNTEVSF